MGTNRTLLDKGFTVQAADEKRGMELVAMLVVVLGVAGALALAVVSMAFADHVTGLGWVSSVVGALQGASK